MQYQLRPFTKDQTGCYIDIQMKQAGGPEDVFDASVKELQEEAAAVKELGFIK